MIIRHKVKEPTASTAIRSKPSGLMSSMTTNMGRSINNAGLWMIELHIHQTLYVNIYEGYLIPLNNSMTKSKFSRFKHDYCKP